MNKTPIALGMMVEFTEPTLHGPAKRRGQVWFIRPDGRIEVRTANGVAVLRDSEYTIANV